MGLASAIHPTAQMYGGIAVGNVNAGRSQPLKGMSVRSTSTAPAPPTSKARSAAPRPVCTVAQSGEKSISPAGCGSEATASVPSAWASQYRSGAMMKITTGTASAMYATVRFI